MPGKIDYTADVEYRRQQAVSEYGQSLGYFVSMPLSALKWNQGEIARTGWTFPGAYPNPFRSVRP